MLQLHGSNDMTCPYQASSWLRDLMSASMDVTYHTHGGAHDMGTSVEIQMIASYLEKLCL